MRGGRKATPADHSIYELKVCRMGFSYLWPSPGLYPRGSHRPSRLDLLGSQYVVVGGEVGHRLTRGMSFRDGIGVVEGDGDDLPNLS